MLATLAPSARASATIKRTYNRPLDPSDPHTRLETWEHTVRRATLDHHRFLWEGAGGRPDEGELKELYRLGLDRLAMVAGRTLWLGGTPYGRDRACANFNCAGTRQQTVYQLVDTFWLLLNGAGVGGKPQAGTMHGFLEPIREVEVIESKRGPYDKGDPESFEQNPAPENDYHWVIRFGDSATSWAKCLGKLVNPPRCRVNKLTLDASECRGPGGRLAGYGWVCNGPGPLLRAFLAIVEILNAKAGDLLTELDLLDIVNWVGTVLSSRRSAELMLMDYEHPLWEEFARAKHGWWACVSCGHAENDSDYFCKKCGGRTRAHRQQSNNSLCFWKKPSRRELTDLLELIWEGGGSEPGFINGAAARRRAPWFDILNPCAEILLSTNGFCNLCTTAVCKFKNDFAALLRAVHVMARANYRQTCVDLNDGILVPEWHQTNEALRLCGVSLTGIAMAPWLTDYQIKQIRNAAVAGAYSMADELGLPRPKLVTTVKPEGTASKCMDVSEGVHTPLGRHIFNWINFPVDSEVAAALMEAGYDSIVNPTDANNRLVKFPVEYPGVRFSRDGDRFVNRETAVDQLNRYRRWNTLWADHNTSVTVSWDIEERDQIVDWLDYHWDDYVGVSWFRRMDPTLRPADAGYGYLPQEVVSAEDYHEYASRLREVDWSNLHEINDVEDAGCASGACPSR